MDLRKNLEEMSELVKQGALPLPTTEEEFLKIFDRPLSDFMVHFWSIQHRNNWGRWRLFKNPFDCWLYQELIFSTKPEVVIEIGSGKGGSALFFCHLLDLLGGDREVITIDVKWGSWLRVLEHPRLRKVRGKSERVVETVEKLARGRRGFVIQDGDHNAKTVYKDLKAYAQFVETGCYFVVEDTLNDFFPRQEEGFRWDGPGPLAGVRRFLEEDNRFEIDYRCHRFLFTVAPFGFLKKVR